MTQTIAIDLGIGSVADVAQVDALMRAAFDVRYGEAWTSGQCLGVMALPGVWLTIARIDGDPVGFALSRAIAGEAELLLLATAPAHRGCGVGGALLRSVALEARAKDAIRLHLEVRRGNSAIALYKAAGFDKVGERRDYYKGSNGQLHDALTYARSLP